MYNVELAPGRKLWRVVYRYICCKQQSLDGHMVKIDQSILRNLYSVQYYAYELDVTQCVAYMPLSYHE